MTTLPISREQLHVGGKHPSGAAPLRIAYVLHSFTMGGAERIAAVLANRADRSRFRPMIICLDRNKTGKRWELSDDVQVLSLQKRSGNDLRIVFRLARVLREQRIDIVHSNNWGTLLETSLARRMAKVPCHVHVEHGVELADLEIGFLKKRLRGTAMRWAFRRVDALVSVCDGVTERLGHRCGIPADRVLRVPNGVETPAGALDPAERQRIRGELGIEPGACVIGSVGRLAAVKDFGTAIEALGRLVGSGHDVHLLLVGDGPERAALAERAKTCGAASRVHLAGEQGRVGPWLAAMDVYVNSSLSEGMSLSILEGMSAGLPLVVTDVGESASLLGSEPPCGLIVPPSRPEALADAMGRWTGDSDLRRRLGTAARQRYEQHYTIRHMVTRYAGLYRGLVPSVAEPIQDPDRI